MSGLSWRQSRHAKRTFMLFAGRDKLLDKAEWRKACDIQNPSIEARIFQLIDTDKSDYIDIKEFIAFLKVIRHPKLEKRLEFLFRVYDQDEDGYLERKELRSLLESSLNEQGLQVQDQDLKALVNCLISKMDLDADKRVSRDDFIRFCSQLDNLNAQFDGFFSRWVPKLKLRKKISVPSKTGSPIHRTNFVKFNFLTLFWSLVYIAANGILLYQTFQEYAQAGLAIQIARASAAGVYLNSALILLPVCRALWTWLRHTLAGRLLPLDKLLSFHRITGVAIVIFSVVHTVAHTVNYVAQGTDLVKVFFFSFIGATGVGLMLVLLLIVNGVIQKHVRRERFTASHFMFAFYLILLLLHGEEFWAWFLLPGVLYLFDALIRTFIKTRKVSLEKLLPLADGVTTMVFKKPRFMNFYPGDYLYMRIPAIARFEWHPFTISAAPETTNLAIHVRNNGDWSGALHNYSRSSDKRTKSLKVYIDGPYGTPTSNVYRSRVAILVAAGIGVTPFASVLQSLLLRDHGKDKLERANQIVHFHWLNRSQRSYEWFTDLMAKAEQQLGSDNFKLNIHLTSLSHNLTNIAMQIALGAFREKHQRDPLTHLQAITSAGRPNWDHILHQAARTYKNERIDLYVCGPTELTRDLKQACRRHGICFHQEEFN